MSIRRRPARGTCPSCRKEKAIRMTKAIAGTMREHGPDCPGVGRPPVEPDPAPLLTAPPAAEETTVEPGGAPERTSTPPSPSTERLPRAGPAYDILDEDDGEIDGTDAPAAPSPALRTFTAPPAAELALSVAEQLEAAASLQLERERRVRFLEGQLDASREAVATLRDELARTRATLSQALALIGRLSPL